MLLGGQDPSQHACCSGVLFYVVMRSRWELGSFSLAGETFMHRRGRTVLAGVVLLDAK